MMKLVNKKISILGAERSGIAAAKLIRRKGGKPFISDIADEKKLSKSIEILKSEGIEYETGGHTERVLNSSLIVISPGVPSDAPIVQEALERDIKVISEIELASRFCSGNIISITGTNGKTTTTSLAAHLLNECGIRTYTGGNIGKAFSEFVLDMKENEFVALETSSFQLDFIDEFKPKFAVILNLTPDHLNRYENNFEKYIKSKLRIYENQTPEDFFITNYDDETLHNWARGNKSKTFGFSLKNKANNGAFLRGDKLFFAENGNTQFSCSADDLSLKGEHNVANALSAIIIAKLIGAENEKLISALKTFPGVEHRLEFVREIDGVKYVNDSKATNVDSVWYALRSFDEPIFLILGGQDKGNDYNKIKDLVLSKVKKIYAIGSSADKIFSFFHSEVKVEIKDSLEACISAVSREARKNDIVLLSPACASFDMFENYEHRGRIFKEAVNKL